ncbi:MAG: thermostable hemolysin [Rhodospirillales bacterium]|nr:thermostable hemolysin [Rhodospirillales bacterium]MCB9996897.1 thermostable hemolysin [Rhodospirillales bacterium]
MLKLRLHENDLNTANLYLAERQLARVSKLTPAIVDITGRFQPERGRVEDFIKGVYARSYGADISVDYPVLMSVRNENGDILAAVGFRYAQDEPLFLEHYTEFPVEQILDTPREQIVEIGNLASAGGGASIFLFAALASYLNSKGIRYATVTGTDYLHRTFKRLGLNPQKICDASLEAVQRDGQGKKENWGTYYDTRPRVLAGSVEQGVARLKRALGAEYQDCRPRLFPRLHYRT